MFGFSKKKYSLNNSRSILQTAYKWYKRKALMMPEEEKKHFEDQLSSLDGAILKGDREEADLLARQLEKFVESRFKKSFFEYLVELGVALIFALLIATLVRQMWFELYEIPTGSMRPTFKEKDNLTVSKLAFGINKPLQTDHFYFDPNLVQRGSVVIFTGENVPYIDQETTYFGILPYKKRYIKRLIAKPGDTVYFYGGKVYILDDQGQWVKEIIDGPWMKGLEHIPFISFEGYPKVSGSDKIYFQQMHIPVASLSINPSGKLIGEVFNGKEWIKDDPEALKKPHKEIKSFADLWGIKNYAMVRLLTKNQLKDSSIDVTNLEEAPLYLELRHTPNLTNPAPNFRQGQGGYGVSFVPFKTVIPLQQKHLDAIMEAMYTSRFIVSDEKARRYNLEHPGISPGNPRYKGIPDGMYEFYYGKASNVEWAGITSELPLDHPLYSHKPENVQWLFNLGIEVDNALLPSAKKGYFPQRYAYFKEGDLYLLGAPVLKKDDPTLLAFNQREKDREIKSFSAFPYIAFKDYGPPVKEDGSLDKEFMKAFGLKVPKDQYLVLGDNHAMSSDSRVFGFIPEKNLQGAPSLILWPPGDGRLGKPAQKPYPLFNFPRMMVWSIALIIAGIWYTVHRLRSRRPIYKKL